MVEVENNSSDFSKALSALPKGVIAGLRGVTSEVSYAMPVTQPAMGELAEAALAYTHEESFAAAPAALALVTNNSPMATAKDASPEASALFNDIIALVTDKDEVASEGVRAEASQLLGEIMGMEPAARAKLALEITSLRKAKDSGKASGISFETIRSMIDAAEKEASGKAAESAEAQRAEALKEIQRLGDAIEKNMDPFYEHMTPEQRARMEKAKEEKRKAEEELERLKANNGTPAQIQAAENKLAAAEVHLGQESKAISQQVAAANPNDPELTQKAKEIKRDADALDDVYSNKFQNYTSNEKTPVAANQNTASLSDVDALAKRRKITRDDGSEAPVAALPVATANGSASEMGDDLAALATKRQEALAALNTPAAGEAANESGTATAVHKSEMASLAISGGAHVEDGTLVSPKSATSVKQPTTAAVLGG